MHISSLPGVFPIGDIGKEAEKFIDFLQAAGQQWWQILPLGPTSSAFGNSPYMALSTHAGNSLFIDIDDLIDQGLLSKKDIPSQKSSEYKIDALQATVLKNNLLQKAWIAFKANPSTGKLKNFEAQHKWLHNYALFMTLKKEFKQKAWYDWPTAYKKRENSAIKDIESKLADSISYYKFEQYVFFTQFNTLQNYAKKKGIKIIGDLPIYVSEDSVDTWSNQDIFDLHPKTGRPQNIAGVPPDYFSETGQRWGNPLYCWHSKDQVVKQKLYKWWEERLRSLFELVDAVRIDHFRGFESYWSVPASHKTAMEGRWIKGPGIGFFKEMEKKLGKLPIIAEDLGVITPKVEKLRDDLDFPGMKILLFAFDGDPNNNYLPHNHPRNSIVYTGTHDNDTIVGWYLDPEVSSVAKKNAKLYANRENDESSSIHHDLIHLALSSPACLSIFPIQDILGFGNDCRMNIPGTSKDNWTWRCAPRFINNDTAKWLLKKSIFFGRYTEKKEKA